MGSRVSKRVKQVQKTIAIKPIKPFVVPAPRRMPVRRGK